MLWSLGGILATALCLVQTGCVTYAARAVPASRLPDAYQAEPRCDKVPVNFTLLRQEPPKEYLLGEGDLLGVYVPTIVPSVPAGAAGAVIQVPIVPPAGGNLVRDPYPPGGILTSPAVGVPLQIGTGGVLSLPRIPAVNLSGKTLTQAADSIRQSYEDLGIIPEGQSVSITLLRPRTNRILVLREDTDASLPQLINIAQVPYTRKGTGDLVDLPAYENDVLHVLAATGGLPGIETYSHVWVLKSSTSGGVAEEAQARMEAGEDAAQVFRALNAQRTAIRIPLRVAPGEQLPFGPQDVILHTGDVVYLEPRDSEVFYTGGILPGREVPMPRDRDIDILEAIAIASGSIGGYGSGPNSATFRNGAIAGNIIPPTRAVVIRKLPNGQQINIRCDLARARHDPRERIIIQPGDFIMMNYKPGEVAGNVALNLTGFNITWLVGQ